jgi:hypothetical protein
VKFEFHKTSVLACKGGIGGKKACCT